MPLAVSLKKVVQVQGRATSHLQEAVRCAKLLKIRNFAQVLERAALAAAVGPHVPGRLRHFPGRINRANPCVQYEGRAFTFEDAFRGSHIHSVFNRHDESQAMGTASLNTCCAGLSCFCWRSCAPHTLLPSSATSLRRPQLPSTT